MKDLITDLSDLAPQHRLFQNLQSYNRSHSRSSQLQIVLEKFWIYHGFPPSNNSQLEFSNKKKKSIIVSPTPSARSGFWQREMEQQLPGSTGNQWPPHSGLSNRLLLLSTESFISLPASKAALNTQTAKPLLHLQDTHSPFLSTLTLPGGFDSGLHNSTCISKRERSVEMAVSWESFWARGFQATR